MSAETLNNPIRLVDAFEQAARLREQLEFTTAIEVLEKAYSQRTLNSESARKLARVFSDLQRPDLAIEVLDVEHLGECPHALADLAVYHELTGNFVQAEHAINQCIDREPDAVEPQLILARVLDHQQEYERAYRIIANIFSQNKISQPRTAIRGLYQLARSLDKLGNFQDAFSAASKAKEIQRQVPSAQSLAQQGLRTLSQARRIHEQLTTEQVAAWKTEQISDSKTQLVHLIGFPRSGTTLLGSRLDHLADVAVASEQDVFLKKILPRLIRRNDDSIELTSGLGSKSIGELRKQHLDLLKPFCRHDHNTQIIVDKRPAHLTFLFALMRIHADSKFIVAVRDPRDIIVSCFMTYFPLSDMSAAFLSLGTSCLMYQQFMSNWFLARRYLGADHFAECRYEELCSQPDITLEQAANWIGSRATITRDPANDNRYIHSPTFSDVRQPIRTTRVGRWQNYASQLKPFLKILDPIARELGYE